MGSWVRRWVWQRVLPELRAWLELRALRLPREVRVQLAERLGVEESCVLAVEKALRARVLELLDRFEW
jgi:hypothetical protein